MKIILAALFSVVLIWTMPAKQDTSDINNTTNAKVQAANVEQARKSATEDIATLQEKTPEPQVSPSETAVNVQTSAKASEPEPQPKVTQATGCEKYRDIIDNYSWNVNTAIAVCNAESSGNANTSNLNDYHSFAGCRGSFGLFQINCSHGKVYDPVENIRIAAAMYQASGWKPWSATTCKYKVQCY